MRWLRAIQGLGLLLLMLSFLSINGLAADDKNKADLATAIGANTVMDIDGQPFQLKDAWKDRPVVLVFIRHFG